MNPCSRKVFIKKLRKLGFSELECGTRHGVMRLGSHKQIIPSNSEYSVPQLKMLLHRSSKSWDTPSLSKSGSGCNLVLRQSDSSALRTRSPICWQPTSVLPSDMMSPVRCVSMVCTTAFWINSSASVRSKE